MSSRREIQLKLRVPKEIRIFQLQLTTRDFNLTWFEYFQTHYKDSLFAKVSSVKRGRYVLRDIRKKPKCKSWELSNRIKEFINSFKRSMPIYNATLVYVANSTIRGATANARQWSEPLASTSRGAGSERLTQTPRNRSGVEITMSLPTRQQTSNRNQAGMPSAVNFDIEFDDSASMADSQVSQDSQDDLIEAGVDLENIKPKVIENFMRHADNNMLLRTRLELQKLKDNGKLYKKSTRNPQCFNLLQLMFDSILKK